MRNLRVSSFIAFLALAVIAIVFITSHNEPVTTFAGSSDNVSGYAWSSNIGWVSFNCTNDSSCGGSSYGVNVDASGNLSGYAWSSNLGWISFNSGDVAGCPGTVSCGPRLDQATGELTGWAKGLAIGGTGWDGFISLNCLNNSSCGGSDYRVTVAQTDPCSWSGWAWGGAVVGWLGFSGSGYGVEGSGNACVTPPPPPPPPPPAVTAFCSGVPATTQTGQPVAWSVTVGGGTPPFTYIWSGTDGLSGTAASIAKTYVTVGVKNAHVDVTDSAAQTAMADCSVTAVRNNSGIIEVKP